MHAHTHLAFSLLQVPPCPRSAARFFSLPSSRSCVSGYVLHRDASSSNVETHSNTRDRVEHTFRDQRGTPGGQVCVPCTYTGTPVARRPRVFQGGPRVLCVCPCARARHGRHTWKRRPRQIHTERAGILLLGRLTADRRRDKTRLTRKLTVISLHLFTLTPADNLASGAPYFT